MHRTTAMSCRVKTFLEDIAAVFWSGFLHRRTANLVETFLACFFFAVLIFDLMCDLISKRKGKEWRIFIYTTASYLPWKNGNDPFLRK